MNYLKIPLPSTSLADKIPSGKVSLVQNSLKNMIYSSFLDPLRIIYLCLHSVHYSLGPFFNYVDKTRQVGSIGNVNSCRFFLRKVMKFLPKFQPNVSRQVVNNWQNLVNVVKGRPLWPYFSSLFGTDGGDLTSHGVCRRGTVRRIGASQVNVTFTRKYVQTTMYILGVKFIFPFFPI